MAAEKKFKFPKSMALCADKIYEIRQKRLDMQKAVDAVEEEEKALKAYIIDNLPKSEATGAAGKLARVTVVTKDVPHVKDWGAFWKAFNKKTDTDLLQRSVSAKAIEARLDAGKKVAGVEIFHAVSLSINKV